MLVVGIQAITPSTRPVPTKAKVITPMPSKAKLDNKTTKPCNKTGMLQVVDKLKAQAAESKALPAGRYAQKATAIDNRELAKRPAGTPPLDCGWASPAGLPFSFDLCMIARLHPPDCSQMRDHAILPRLSHPDCLPDSYA